MKVILPISMIITVRQYLNEVNGYEKKYEKMDLRYSMFNE
jgi:hypothetical protein